MGIHFGNIVVYIHEQRKIPGCLGYIGDEILPSYVGIRIPMKQPVFHGKYPRIFVVAHMISKK